MPVQIIINGESAKEAIQELFALSASITSQTATAESVPSLESTKAERSVRRTKPQTVATPPAPDPEPKPEPDPIDDSNDTFDEPIPTDVELREIARKIGTTPEGKAEIKALLSKYGVANITAVPNEKRIAFKRDLEALML